ncbi:DUF1016 N-terminal domain-containing protein [Leptospira koniambonensis]|uniref:DUF1016 N-terminal domain-containing protein n=1 Tax=Leptospira koniambonensis TaxID=2484950 RepID=UPI003EBD3B1C
MNRKNVKNLTDEIKEVYESLKSDISSGGNTLILEANRKIGKLLVKTEKGLKDKEKASGSWIKGISKELKKTIPKGFSERMLFYAYKFYHVYGDSKLNPKLSWSHYRSLASVSDDSLRKKLEIESIRNNWNRDELAMRIREAGELRQARMTRWKRPSGELFHYKVREMNQKPKKYSLDLGFYIYHNLEKGRKYKEGEVYKVSNIRNSWKLTRANIPISATYCYSGEIERVIDGDTLLVRIDLGFEKEIRQRIRLSGVWAWELDSEEGKSSFHQLSEKLPVGTKVIVKTKTKDIYGRYVGDVLYSNARDVDIFREGIYLNEELSLVENLPKVLK